MRSICFYSSYFDQPAIPYYIRFYLKELTIHFSEIVFLTNEKKLDDESSQFLKDKNIELMYVKNEGWDFGMWYKAIEKKDVGGYQKLALVNDSCILFTSLQKFMDWADKSGSDYLGISQSEAVSRHIQSYFLIIKNNAIPAVVNYFKKIGILKDIKEVISKYEIGLSKHLLDQGFKMDAYVSNENYKGEFSPYYHLIYSHLEQGVPVIKKKIIFLSYRPDELFTLARMNFNIDPDRYIAVISRMYPKTELIDFDSVKKDQQAGLNSLQVFVYDLKRCAVQVMKKVKRIFN